MTAIDRRHLLTAAAAGSVLAVGAAPTHASPRMLPFADMKKDTDLACLYHCDFGNDPRYSALLRNINNHLEVYNFDPFKIKIVIVAHSAGIKYHLKTLAGTPWSFDPPIDPELGKRMDALAKYGVEVYLCNITFQTDKIDITQAKDAPYIRIVPSGVATVSWLQTKGYAYLKVG